MAGCNAQWFFKFNKYKQIRYVFNNISKSSSRLDWPQEQVNNWSDDLSDNTSISNLWCFFVNKWITILVILWLMIKCYHASLRLATYSNKRTRYSTLTISSLIYPRTCLKDSFSTGYCCRRTAGLRLNTITITVTARKRKIDLLPFSVCRT